MEENQEIVEETIVDNGETVGSEEVGQVEEVIETTEEQESIETSETEEEQEDIQNTQETEEPVVFTDSTQEAKFTQKQLDKIVKKRLERQNKNFNDEIQPYKQLVETLKAGGFDATNIDELNQKIRANYAEQGVELPELKSQGLTDKEQKLLAQNDANEVIELGEEVMEERFLELFNKPNKTIREQEEMNLIGIAHSKRTSERKLLELGVDPKKVMNDPKFQEFARKIKVDVPLEEVYEMYKKVNNQQMTKPASAGSVKSTSVNTKVDYNTMSQEDFNRELEKVLNS